MKNQGNVDMLRYGKVILTYTWSELDFNATTMCAL